MDSNSIHNQYSRRCENWMNPEDLRDMVNVPRTRKRPNSSDLEGHQDKRPRKELENRIVYLENKLRETEALAERKYDLLNDQYQIALNTTLDHRRALEKSNRAFAQFQDSFNASQVESINSGLAKVVHESSIEIDRLTFENKKLTEKDLENELKISQLRGDIERAKAEGDHKYEIIELELGKKEEEIGNLKLLLEESSSKIEFFQRDNREFEESISLIIKDSDKTIKDLKDEKDKLECGNAVLELSNNSYVSSQQKMSESLNSLQFKFNILEEVNQRYAKQKEELENKSIELAEQNKELKQNSIGLATSLAKLINLFPPKELNGNKS